MGNLICFTKDLVTDIQVLFTNSLSPIGVPFSWLGASVLPDAPASLVLLSARGGLVKSRGNERMLNKLNMCSWLFFFCLFQQKVVAYLSVATVVR